VKRGTGEFFNEPSKDEVIGDVISWLEKRL